MLKPPDKTMYEYIFDILDGVVVNRAAIEYKTTVGMPDEYCVFYLVASTPQGFFSGSYSRENARYSVCIYSRDKRALDAKEPAIKAAMIAAGFLYVAKSRDIYSKETGHWQRTFDFRYYEEVQTCLTQ